MYLFIPLILLAVFKNTVLLLFWSMKARYHNIIISPAQLFLQLSMYHFHTTNRKEKPVYISQIALFLEC